MARRSVVAAAFVLWSGGCSLLYGWDRDGLPCQKDPASGALQCYDGYSCAFLASDPSSPVCVADGTLAADDACLLDRQCPKNYICPTAVGRCVAACDPLQAFAAGCGANTYCSPSLSTGMYSGSDVDGQVVPVPQLIGGCLPSDNCTANAACVGNSGTLRGGICVVMNNAARACIVGCTPAPGNSPTSYSDNCAADTLTGTKQVCQPVGPVFGQQQFVCLPSVPATSSTAGALGARQARGQACSAAAQPCTPGDLCINGVCRKYCTANQPGTSSTCPGNDQCCEIAGLASNPGHVGYCITSCP